eukprot:122574_1
MSDDGVADTADETRTWLHENGLSCITDKCLKNEMTLEILMEATITDIKIMCDEANIKTQHRLKLQSALKKLPMSMISQQRIPSPINRKVMSDDGVADTADETRTWLHENGLSCITDKCLKNEMTLEILMEATITDIKIMCDEANIKTQHRLKLQSALKKLPMSMISQQRIPSPINRKVMSDD